MRKTRPNRLLLLRRDAGFLRTISKLMLCNSFVRKITEDKIHTLNTSCHIHVRRKTCTRKVSIKIAILAKFLHAHTQRLRTWKNKAAWASRTYHTSIRKTECLQVRKWYLRESECSKEESIRRCTYRYIISIVVLFPGFFMFAVFELHIFGTV